MYPEQPAPLAPLSVVRLPHGIPKHGIPAGAIATILDVFEQPSPAYEIEVADENGRSLYLGSVPATDVEPYLPDASD